MPPTDSRFKVLQITDTHLVADPSGKLLGQVTRDSFEAVVEAARARFWPPDLILLTGDLVHDERPDTYRYLADRLKSLGIPYFAIPGNHDRVELLAELLDSDAARGVRIYKRRAWQLALLDSTVTGEDGGQLGDERLTALDRDLGRSRLPTLVCLHHQPVPIGSAWLDKIGLANGPELMRLVARHTHVRALLWGHIHQAYSGEQAGIRLLGSPSTCVQFRPHCESFTVDRLAPGFRWLSLRADGQIDTGIERIDSHSESVDLSAGGY